MGERVSVRFVLSEPVWGFSTEPSPWLYGHWDGPDLVRMASEFTEELGTECDADTPRADPSTAMIGFIQSLGRQTGGASYRLYSGCPYAGDWGDWEVDLLTDRVRPFGTEEWTDRLPDWTD